MVDPRPNRRGRVWTLALLGVMGVVLAPRPAEAFGCHEDERPRFGLTMVAARSGLDLGSIGQAMTPANWAVRPCQGETPANPDRVTPIGPFLLVDRAIVRPVAAGEIEAPSAFGRVTRVAWSDLSRPPRND